MHEMESLDFVAYPPPPWNSRGQMWMDIFDSKGTPELPSDLKPVLGANRIAIIVVRYLEGALRYDELMFGTIARRGLRVGYWTDRIWVDSPASVWGGRRIWGVPKNPARFDWADDRVTVSDSRGLVAGLSLDRRDSVLPWMYIPTPFLGDIDGVRCFAIGQLWGRPGRAGLEVREWPDRFGYRPQARSHVGFASKPFRMSVTAAKMLPEIATIGARRPAS